MRVKRASCLLWISLSCPITAVPGFAAGLQLRVLDRDGRGVGDVVMVAMPEEPPDAASSAMPAPQATMDQVGRQFVPHVLVVRTGTAVAFPNSDSVAHQVYSFSPAKRFQLALYRGHAYPPPVFDNPGLVVVGCNIHDDMLAYIYVTPAPYFGKTDARGSLVLDRLPARQYHVTLWSPRLNEPHTQLTRTIRLEAEQQLPLPIRLTRALSPERRRPRILHPRVRLVLRTAQPLIRPASCHGPLR